MHSRHASFRAPLYALALVAATSTALAQPVLSTSIPDVTADKPQSKLWFARGSWWAWLASPSGSAVWKREAKGWTKVSKLDRSLGKVKGRADVFCDVDGVHVAVLDKRRVTIVRLVACAESERPWKVADLSRPIDLCEPSEPPIETVTIARDGAGRSWMAYVRSRHVVVRAWQGLDPHADAISFRAGGPVHPDDIAAITRLPGAIGVVWSDQDRHALRFRLHSDRAPTPEWHRTETVLEGHGLADDHINLAVSPDGTLYAATKNSVDTVGRAQLGLYVRRPNGDWELHPFASRTRIWEPTRPIVLLSNDGSEVHLLYSAYDRRSPRSEPAPIFHISTKADSLRLAEHPARPLIRASTDLNNVSGPKNAAPSPTRTLVLASDSRGDVYEGELPLRRDL